MGSNSDNATAIYGQWCKKQNWAHYIISFAATQQIVDACEIIHAEKGENIFTEYIKLACDAT